MTKPHSTWRIPLLIIGWTLLFVAPIVGAVPGPGGVFVFAAGAVLLLRNSHWCRRRYVLFKRRWPRLGNASDRVMRRASARRRALRVERALAGD